MRLNNAADGGQESWILDALNNHSTMVWHESRGALNLYIYQVHG